MISLVSIQILLLIFALEMATEALSHFLEGSEIAAADGPTGCAGADPGLPSRALSFLTRAAAGGPAGALDA